MRRFAIKEAHTGADAQKPIGRSTLHKCDGAPSLIDRLGAVRLIGVDCQGEGCVRCRPTSNVLALHGFDADCEFVDQVAICLVAAPQTLHNGLHLAILRVDGVERRSRADPSNADAIEHDRESTRHAP